MTKKLRLNPEITLLLVIFLYDATIFVDIVRKLSITVIVTSPA